MAEEVVAKLDWEMAVENEDVCMRHCLKHWNRISTPIMKKIPLTRNTAVMILTEHSKGCI